MEQQSTIKQVGIGAFFGVLFTTINWLRKSTPERLISAYGISTLVGGAVGGIVIYMVLYRFWPKKK